ncbi:hypothetical protein QYM36_013883, partial [Artemia franciscana]
MAIKRPHHPMPTFYKAVLKYSGAKYFTKLEARHGYWWLELDEDLSELTTFNTPYDRYKFKRMPFGLISAQDEFQRRLEEAFEGIKGFSIIVDDIIISGRTNEEQDSNVRSTLIRAREKCVKLNLQKCRAFKWKEEHNSAFTNIKESICDSLSFFDPTSGNIELQVDASKFGLGATILQNGKTVSFASRSLNRSEQNYSQIEKELYAILFGCLHYHQYLYGQKFIVLSDHKPLQVVLNRSILKSSPRLQRMLLKIHPYDFKVIFRPGKEIPVADALSRLYFPEEDTETQMEIESAVSRCRTYKTTQAQLKSFSGSKPISIKQEVDATTRGPGQNSFRNQKASVNNHTKGRDCYFCGGSYSTNHACPAKGKICTQCKKPNHFARVCCSNKNVNTIDEETESFREAVDDQETIFLYAIDKGSGKDEALVPLTLNNQLSVNFKIDTGAQANVILKNIFDKLDPKPNLQSTNQRLTSYCGARIPVIGTCDLTCSHKQYPRGAHRFYVVDSASTPIVGYQSSIDLNLIKLVLNVNAEQTSIDDKYKSLFEGIGRLEGECNIHLKDGELFGILDDLVLHETNEDFKKALSELQEDNIDSRFYVSEWRNCTDATGRSNMNYNNLQP